MKRFSTYQSISYLFNAGIKGPGVTPDVFVPRTSQLNIMRITESAGQNCLVQYVPECFILKF
jgi:hypothetical protein